MLRASFCIVRLLVLSLFSDAEMRCHLIVAEVERRFLYRFVIYILNFKIAKCEVIYLFKYLVYEIFKSR